jgi:hypothetical protein
MSSDSEANKNSILVSLPPEILIKVLSEVPLSSFLALTHTSRGLRAFVKDNAAKICNMAIRSRFAEHIKILEATTNNNQGWLLPGPGMLKESEDLYLETVLGRCWWFRRYIDSACGRSRSGVVYYKKTRHHSIRGRRDTHFSLLGPKWSNNWNVTSTPTNNFLNFGMPGPHFLYLLESVPLEVSEEPFENLTAWSDTGGEELFGLYYRFVEEEFYDFMDTFNFNMVHVGYGKVHRAVEGFPKELIWYFGVDKLVVKARDGQK